MDIPHVLVKLFNKHTNISLKVKKARQETLEVIENGELERPSSRYLATDFSERCVLKRDGNNTRFPFWLKESILLLGIVPFFSLENFNVFEIRMCLCLFGVFALNKKT